MGGGRGSADDPGVHHLHLGTWLMSEFLMLLAFLALLALSTSAPTAAMEFFGFDFGIKTNFWAKGSSNLIGEDFRDYFPLPCWGVIDQGYFDCRPG